MAAVVLVGRAEGAESCLLHQAASWKLSLCTVSVLNHPLSRRDFFSLSVLNNDLRSGCTEPVEDVVLLLKAPRTRGSLGARNWLYQLAFAVELVMDLSDSLGRGPWPPESCQDAALTLCRPKICVCCPEKGLRCPSLSTLRWNPAWGRSCQGYVDLLPLAAWLKVTSALCFAVN